MVKNNTWTDLWKQEQKLNVKFIYTLLYYQRIQVESWLYAMGNNFRSTSVFINRTQKIPKYKYILKAKWSSYILNLNAQFKSICWYIL